MIKLYLFMVWYYSDGIKWIEIDRYDQNYVTQLYNTSSKGWYTLNTGFVYLDPKNNIININNYECKLINNSF
jgi:hypothetical protein